MMSRRPHPEQPHIEHVRNPSQRVPIGLRSRSKSPRQAARSKPPLDLQIRSHISGIVVVDESVFERRVVERQSAEEEQKPDERYGDSMLRHYYFLAGRDGTGIVLNQCPTWFAYECRDLCHRFTARSQHCRSTLAKSPDRTDERMSSPVIGTTRISSRLPRSISLVIVSLKPFHEIRNPRVHL